MKILLASLLVGTTSVCAAPTDRPTLEVPFASVEPSLARVGQDAVWSEAVNIDQLAPPLGNTPAEKQPVTKVSLLWTTDHLWIRFQCEASAIKRLPEISPSSAPRDLPYYQADCVEIFLDPVGDGKADVELQISPDNGVFDGIYLYTADVESGPDFIVKPEIIRDNTWFFPQWNLPGLQTAAAIHLDTTPKGWDVVVAIPAQGLQRLPTKEFAAGMTLRANFLRFDYSAQPAAPGRITNWAAVPAGRAHRAPAGMGFLQLRGAPGSAR